MPKNRSIETLIEDARRGDRDAFDELVREVQGELRSFVISRLGPALRQRHEPEDIVQDALVKGFENIERFQWRGPQSLKRWLFTIAEHLIRNASRKQSLVSGPLSVEVPGEQPSPSCVMRREERLKRLRRSLEALRPDHREVIELARIEGLPIAEIARRMDRSPGAIKQLLSRALESLKGEFGDTQSLNLPQRGSKYGSPSEGGTDG